MSAGDLFMRVTPNQVAERKSMIKKFAAIDKFIGQVEMYVKNIHTANLSDLQKHEQLKTFYESVTKQLKALNEFSKTATDDDVVMDVMLKSKDIEAWLSEFASKNGIN